MNPILFLDIDGVLIPRRMYDAPNQTRPLVTVFDPGVVGMLNTLARECGAQFVIHSSWLRSNFAFISAKCGCTDVKQHMICQGLDADAFHKDHSCQYRFSGTRWTAICDWLEDHPEVTNLDYWIIEDEPHPYYDGVSRLNLNRIIQTDFDEGLTWKQFQSIYTAEVSS